MIERNLTETSPPGAALSATADRFERGPVESATSPPAEARSLDRLFEDARAYDRERFVYSMPSPERCAAMTSLVYRAARVMTPGAPSEPLRAEARALGLELDTARDAGGILWVLHEPAGRREGAGLFALRPGGRPLILEAPHTFYDRETGDIARAAFAELRAGAYFCNTVHRYATTTSAEKDADVAHAPRSLFHSATEGMFSATGWPVVQVHGYGPGREALRGRAGVVADGTPGPPADGAAARLRTALRGRVPEPFALFGDDAHELGATTNVQGDLVRGRNGVFVHVEMSAETRAALERDATPLAAALEETFLATSTASPARAEAPREHAERARPDRRTSSGEGAQGQG